MIVPRGAVGEIRARMTWSGQKSPTILSEHVHMLCTRQPVQRNFPVRSKSYSAAYSHPLPLSSSKLLLCSSPSTFYTSNHSKAQQCQDSSKA